MKKSNKERCRRARAKFRLRYNQMSLDWHYANRDRILKRKRDSYVRKPLPGHSKSIWYSVLINTAARAKRKSLECDLTQEWVLARWTGRCEITGLEFKKGNRRGPSVYSPSIDRIDQSKGYLQSNCRFILFAINAMRGSGGDSDIGIIARAIVASLEGSP